MTITELAEAHATQILDLYKAITLQKDGIIRKEHELTLTYVDSLITVVKTNGLGFVAELNGNIIGIIHASTPQLFVFQHLLSDLSVMIHPQNQSKGIGRKLFTHFLDYVQSNMPHILRVELHVREHNLQNVNFYESLGFKKEGRFENKLYISEMEFQTPLQMVWFNPNFRNNHK